MALNMATLSLNDIVSEAYTETIEHVLNFERTL